MKIDLHVHTKERSHCGWSPQQDHLEAAVKAGLDAIVFTDHGRLAPSNVLARFNKAYAPFRIFGGIEITVAEGEDILVLGIQDPDIEGVGWSYADLHAFVRERNGFLAVAHPFRYREEIGLPLKDYPPDALEIYSYNTPLQAEEDIARLAGDLGLVTLSNSDAHVAEFLGRYYNLLDETPKDEADLVHMLRQGMFKGVAECKDGRTREFRPEARGY